MYLNQVQTVWAIMCYTSEFRSDSGLNLCLKHMKSTEKLQYEILCQELVVYLQQWRTQEGARGAEAPAKDASQT